MAWKDAQKRPTQNMKGSQGGENIPGGCGVLWCKFLL